VKVEREFADAAGEQAFELAATLADEELAALVDEHEATSTFPRDLLRRMGKLGLLALPYPVDDGGGGLTYQSYVQVIERLAYQWLAVAESVHLHVIACYGVATYGTPTQRAELLPAMLSGEQLGAICLSESQAGSDLGAIATTATRDGDEYVVRGTKSWTSHAGVADFYNIYCRTGGPGITGLSCLLADASTPGILPHRPERKMGVRSLPTAQIVLDDVRLPKSRVIGRPGRGFVVASAGFDHARLGITACAVGLAQAALDHAAAHARGTTRSDRLLIDHQGLAFTLADLATQVSAARALLLSAARLKDAGRPFATEAAKAKLFATDTAMRVTVDAVQVLGSDGYSCDEPVERWFREAKLLQIIEGTNQIQRAAIARTL